MKKLLIGVLLFASFSVQANGFKLINFSLSTRLMCEEWCLDLYNDECCTFKVWKFEFFKKSVFHYNAALEPSRICKAYTPMGLLCYPYKEHLYLRKGNDYFPKLCNIEIQEKNICVDGETFDLKQINEKTFFFNQSWILIEM